MKEYGELSAQMIVSELTADAVPQEHPVVVFVAGQAGSGKTLVMDLVHAALEQRGGAVRVERDAYKVAHPGYVGFLAEDVRTAGVRVRPETYRWQAEVEARARACRYDVVAEEAAADPAAWLAALAAYREAGYRTEVVALAGPGMWGGTPRHVRGRAARRPRGHRGRAPGRPGRRRPARR
ncbi:zeta toxin family protein [Streptomyces sp. NBC_01243]|uniref:zeta toxin family protein n=1 Tax=Streptomyces sp. NBC_01243 TaxID=2903796 RepID=UPI002E0E8B53|nr:zeta toxin family protein [Streptomyces sp. NBC_01243]